MTEVVRSLRSGQAREDPRVRPRRPAAAAATGPTPVDLHGMISLPKQNRVYFGYGTNKGGVMQIVDREKLLNGPKEPTAENLL